MIFFTSDLHLNHKNIIKYCNRPFSSVNEMNETIINNWNSKIKENDLTYILGDFAFHDDKNLLHHLNGKKILIQGDHDKQIHYQSYLKVSYLDILDHHNIIDTETKNYFNTIISSITLCHWCMRVWRKSHFNSWHLYGHSHGKLSPIGKSWDVGVDNNNFYPLSLIEIINIMNKQSDNPNLVKDRYAKT